MYHIYVCCREDLAGDGPPGNGDQLQPRDRVHGLRRERSALLRGAHLGDGDGDLQLRTTRRRWSHVYILHTNALLSSKYVDFIITSYLYIYCTFLRVSLYAI